MCLVDEGCGWGGGACVPPAVGGWRFPDLCEEADAVGILWAVASDDAGGGGGESVSLSAWPFEVEAEGVAVTERVLGEDELPDAAVAVASELAFGKSLLAVAVEDEPGLGDVGEPLAEEPAAVRETVESEMEMPVVGVGTQVGQQGLRLSAALLQRRCEGEQIGVVQKRGGLVAVHGGAGGLGGVADGWRQARTAGEGHAVRACGRGGGG